MSMEEVLPKRKQQIDVDKLEKLSKEYRKLNDVKCPICKKIVGNWVDKDTNFVSGKYIYCQTCKIRLYEF